MCQERRRRAPRKVTNYFVAAGASGWPGCCLLAGSMWSQERALFVQMLSVIFRPAESSSEPARRVIISGVVARSLQSGEPQSPQKKRCSRRPLSAVLLKRLGVPCVTLKADFETAAPTVPPAPEARWQSRQWHERSSAIGALIA